MFHNKKLFIGNFYFPTESFMTKKVILEKFRKKKLSNLKQVQYFIKKTYCYNEKNEF